MRIKEIREGKGWTQGELAKRCGFHQSAIGHWESGRREPSLTNASKLANVLGVTLDALAGISEPKDGDARWRAELSSLMQKL